MSICGQGYFPGELHVGYVTNGVHYPTWTCPEIRSLLEHNVKDKTYQNNPVWENIYHTSDEKLWSVTNAQREKLINYIRERLANPQIVKYESPRHVVEIQEKLRSDVLTIGFARRFATYKRAHLLIRDLDRLNNIVNNKEMPVQFIFAGKAHPTIRQGRI